ncbi:hypothetical protein Tco_1312899 [Tanacetum coccineum]
MMKMIAEMALEEAFAEILRFPYVHLGCVTPFVLGGKIRDMLFQIHESEADVFIKHDTQSRSSRQMALNAVAYSNSVYIRLVIISISLSLFDAIVKVMFFMF